MNRLDRLLPGIFLSAVCASAQAPVPAISPGGVVNSASQAPQALPNGSIAEGSLFTVYLSNVLPISSGSATHYPLTSAFNGVSMTVTVNSTAVSVLMYSTAPFSVGNLSGTVIDGILPSSTPVGTGTITVAYNGQTSAPAPVTVVAGSFGWFANNEGGNGPGDFTDALSGARITPTNSASPGEFITGWGTGLGPAPGTDANGGSVALIPAGLILWVGGQQVTPSFTGRSTSAGEDQINFQIPANVTGCFVPVVLQIGNIVSNSVTIPVAASGAFCGDANGFSHSDIQNAQFKGSLAYGTVVLSQISSVYSAADEAVANFAYLNATKLFTSLGAFQQASVGMCTVSTFSGSSASIQDLTPLTPLDAGADINITNSAGSQQAPETVKGSYFAPLGVNYLNAGAYTIDNGAGGADVSAFSTSVTIPAVLQWTNQTSANVFTRSQGLTVHWSGGDPNGFVVISGFSIEASPQVGAIFTCTAANSAGQFTVPPAVLLALPASPSGALSVSGISAPVRFTAKGLDAGIAISSAGISQPAAYQ